MLVMVRLSLFFILLSLAAVYDVRKRMIPDWIPLLLAGVSLISPETVQLSGLLPAALLLFVGVTAGGIGGGDIKLAGACGLVLGFEKNLAGLIVGFCLLLGYHAIVQCVEKIRKSDMEMGKEQVYPFVPFLLSGMIFCIGIGG